MNIQYNITISPGGSIKLKEVLFVSDTDAIEDCEYTVLVNDKELFTTKKKSHALDIFYKAICDYEFIEYRVRCPICKKWSWTKVLKSTVSSEDFDKYNVVCKECFENKYKKEVL